MNELYFPMPGSGKISIIKKIISFSSQDKKSFSENQLIGTDLNSGEKIALEVLSGKIKKGKIPELLDGKTSDRITEYLVTD